MRGNTVDLEAEIDVLHFSTNNEIYLKNFTISTKKNWLWKYLIFTKKLECHHISYYLWYWSKGLNTVNTVNTEMYILMTKVRNCFKISTFWLCNRGHFDSESPFHQTFSWLCLPNHSLVILLKDRYLKIFAQVLTS